jgi:tetratricopeptide (TPR) repeat protein
MQNHKKHLLYALVLSAGFQLVGCSRPDWFIGTGGKYNEGKYELMRRVGGDMDKAIDRFESIAREDPTYKDSLTQLGKAYYKKTRYRDAHAILQRALALNDRDDLAWLIYGITQLRLGDNARGLETTKSALTLFSKVSVDGYRGYNPWDIDNKVKNATRRAVFAALKGLEDKEGLIRSVEAILAAVDDEEFYLTIERPQQLKGMEG